MFNDLLGNIIAVAPFEALYGLLCSCKRAAATPVDRSRFERVDVYPCGDTPISICEYPNGYRVRANIDEWVISYENDNPVAATTASAMSEHMREVLSLDLGISYAQFVGNAKDFTVDYAAMRQFGSKNIFIIYPLDQSIDVEFSHTLSDILFAGGTTCPCVERVIEAIELYARRVVGVGPTAVESMMAIMLEPASEDADLKAQYQRALIPHWQRVGKKSA